MRRVLGSRNTRGRGNSRWSEGAHGTQDTGARDGMTQIGFDLVHVICLVVFICLFYYHLDTLKLFGKRNLNWKKLSIGKCKCVGHFLIDYWCGRAQAILGCAIPELVVLGWVRKQTEQAMESKSISHVPLWPLLQSGLQFPPWTSSIRNYNLWSQISPFSPSCFTTWSWYLLQQ